MPGPVVVDRSALVAALRTVGTKLLDDLPEGVGFTLLLFTYDAPGFAAYLSSAEREDAIRGLREMIERLERGDS